MSKHLKRLVYVSSARPAPNHAELAGILNVARTRNSEAAVSGLLLYHDGSFFQILEGAPEDVDRVFARIAADERHGGMIVMSNQSVAKRAFAEWSMAYVAPTALSAEQREGFLSLRAREAADFTGCAATQTFIDSYLGMFRELEAA